MAGPWWIRSSQGVAVRRFARPAFFALAFFAATSFNRGSNDFLQAETPEPRAAAGEAQIAGLIRDLGSERFAAREAASDRLARIGLPALEALEQASRHADREIRFRAEQVLVLVRKNDLERRLAAFMAGSTENNDKLPAWPQFAEEYGDTETSRKVFVGMQRAEPELLSALQRDPRSAVELLGRRLAERALTAGRGNVGPITLSPGEMFAYLFVAAQEDAPVSASSLYLLLQISGRPLADMQRSSPEFALSKQLLGGVIRRCDGEAMLAAIELSREFRLAEGLTPAFRFLEQHDKLNAGSAVALVAPLAFIGDLGDQTHVAAVEKLLDNRTLIGSASMRVEENGQAVTRRKEMQVRDAALTTLLKLTDQNLVEYYGQELPRTASNSPYQSFPAAIVGFESEEKRAAVFQKWAAYKATRQVPKETAETKQPAP